MENVCKKVRKQGTTKFYNLSYDLTGGPGPPGPLSESAPGLYHIRNSICHEKKHFVVINTLWP